MIKLKKIITYFALSVIGILILGFLSANTRAISTAANMMQFNEVAELHLLGTLYCFLFGILLSWRNFEGLIKRDIQIKFNKFFILGIFLLLISSIHPSYIMIKLGPFVGASDSVGNIWIYILTAPLRLTTNIHNILSVLAGMAVIKGICDKREDISSA